MGSVGPYGAHLHDGSEYDGSYADATTVEVKNIHILTQVSITLIEATSLYKNTKKHQHPLLLYRSNM